MNERLLYKQSRRYLKLLLIIENRLRSRIIARYVASIRLFFTSTSMEILNFQFVAYFEGQMENNCFSFVQFFFIIRNEINKPSWKLITCDSYFARVHTSPMKYGVLFFENFFRLRFSKSFEIFYVSLFTAYAANISNFCIVLSFISNIIVILSPFFSCFRSFIYSFFFSYWKSIGIVKVM